jgi:hypothetical protein
MSSSFRKQKFRKQFIKPVIPTRAIEELVDYLKERFSNTLDDDPAKPEVVTCFDTRYRYFDKLTIVDREKQPQFLKPLDWRK